MNTRRHQGVLHGSITTPDVAAMTSAPGIGEIMAQQREERSGMDRSMAERASTASTTLYRDLGVQGAEDTI